MGPESQFLGFLISNDGLSGDGAARKSFSSFSGCEKCASSMVADMQFVGFGIPKDGLYGDLTEAKSCSLLSGSEKIVSSGVADVRS